MLAKTWLHWPRAAIPVAQVRLMIAQVRLIDHLTCSEKISKILESCSEDRRYLFDLDFIVFEISLTSSQKIAFF